MKRHLTGPPYRLPSRPRPNPPFLDASLLAPDGGRHGCGVTVNDCNTKYMPCCHTAMPGGAVGCRPVPPATTSAGSSERGATSREALQRPWEGSDLVALRPKPPIWGPKAHIFGPPSKPPPSKRLALSFPVSHCSIPAPLPTGLFGLGCRQARRATSVRDQYGWRHTHFWRVCVWQAVFPCPELWTRPRQPSPTPAHSACTSPLRSELL